jgi:CelD/BcsL family acetyltransferase involved in cellulose biosynthesis
LSKSEINVIRTFDDLERIKPEWAILSDRFRTPLLDHDWLTCAARSFHRESDLRVITIRRRGALTAAAPMALDAVKRHLVPLGSAKLFEPSGWLYSSEDDLAELARAVVSVGPAALIDRADSSSGLFNVLPRFRYRAVSICRATADSFFIPTRDLPVNWMSNRARRKIEATQANAERECGGVRFVRTAPSPEEARAAVDFYASVESAGWKARHGSSLSKRAELLGFFRDYATRAAAKQRLRLSVLWIGDAAAAVGVSVEAYRRTWSLKLAYDERFAKYGPSIQLVHAEITTAIEDQLDAYEFLGAAESWQQRWHPLTRSHQLAAIYPLNGSAMATAILDATSYVSRRLRQGPRAASALVMP